MACLSVAAGASINWASSQVSTKSDLMKDYTFGIDHLISSVPAFSYIQQTRRAWLVKADIYTDYYIVDSCIEIRD